MVGCRLTALLVRAFQCWRLVFRIRMRMLANIWKIKNSLRIINQLNAIWMNLSGRMTIGILSTARNSSNWIQNIQCRLSSELDAFKKTHSIRMNKSSPLKRLIENTIFFSRSLFISFHCHKAHCSSMQLRITIWMACNTLTQTHRHIPTTDINIIFFISPNKKTLDNELPLHCREESSKKKNNKKIRSRWIHNKLIVILFLFLHQKHRIFSLFLSHHLYRSLGAFRLISFCLIKKEMACILSHTKWEQNILNWFNAMHSFSEALQTKPIRSNTVINAVYCVFHNVLNVFAHRNDVACVWHCRLPSNHQGNHLFNFDTMNYCD